VFFCVSLGQSGPCGGAKSAKMGGFLGSEGQNVTPKMGDFGQSMESTGSTGGLSFSGIFGKFRESRGQKSKVTTRISGNSTESGTKLLRSGNRRHSLYRSVELIKLSLDLRWWGERRGWRLLKFVESGLVSFLENDGEAGIDGDARGCTGLEGIRSWGCGRRGCGRR